ncbi:hypothetical protein D3C71_1649090 [compost metagenome]
MVMLERPLMSLLRASFIKLCLLWVSREDCAVRACPCRDFAARLAESDRALFFSLEAVLLPEPPDLSPPPDCLLTVAQARDSASSFESPLCS